MSIMFQSATEPPSAERSSDDRHGMPTFILRIGRTVFVGCRFDRPSETIDRVRRSA